MGERENGREIAKEDNIVIITPFVFRDIVLSERWSHNW